VQEVFITARRKLPTYEGRGSPKTWLYGIARGLCANVRRSQRRSAARFWAVPSEEAPPDPDEQFGRHEAYRRVVAFLATLPEDQRAVFELSDIEGMSGPEIAEALGIKLNAAYSRLRLARQRLERFIEESEGRRGR